MSNNVVYFIDCDNNGLYKSTANIEKLDNKLLSPRFCTGNEDSAANYRLRFDTLNGDEDTPSVDIYVTKKMIHDIFVEGIKYVILTKNCYSTKICNTVYPDERCYYKSHYNIRNNIIFKLLYNKPYTLLCNISIKPASNNKSILIETKFYYKFFYIKHKPIANSTKTIVLTNDEAEKLMAKIKN